MTVPAGFAKSGAQRSPRETAVALPIALLRARDAVMSRFRPMLAEIGVTEQQWRVLRVLNEAGPLDQTEVAARCVILAPSLTRIVRALEAAGWLARSADPDDGRRQLLAITARGRRLVLEATVESNRIYADLEAAFGEDRIETLLALLGDLARIEAGSKR